MLTVIYRFHLRPEQEAFYPDCWQIVAKYFKQQRGALGSTLYKDIAGKIWVAISRWPDEQTRAASWNKDIPISADYPSEVQQALAEMKKIRLANVDLPQYPEMCLSLVALA